MQVDDGWVRSARGTLPRPDPTELMDGSEIGINRAKDIKNGCEERKGWGRRGKGGGGTEK